MEDTGSFIIICLNAKTFFTILLSHCVTAEIICQCLCGDFKSYYLALTFHTVNIFLSIIYKILANLCGKSAFYDHKDT